MNGPTYQDVKLATLAAIAVPKNTAIYTDPIDLSGLENFSLAYLAACTGTPDVKIEIEQAETLPGTANAADDWWKTPTGLSAIEANLTGKTAKRVAISPICCRYIRFKITEQTNTVTDLVMTLRLSYQNKFAQ